MAHPALARLHRTALAAAMLFTGLPAAHAASIVWGPAAAITGDSDVNTQGALVAAYNFGGAATTVNGVLFDGFAIGAPQQVSVTAGGLYTLSIVPERVEHTLTSFDTSSLGAPFSGLSTAYQQLLGSAAGSNFADRLTRLTMAGLVVGQRYTFQAWANDSRSSGAFSYGLSVDNQDLDPNTARDLAGDVVAGGVGQHITGSFVADAGSQALEFVRGEVGGGLNGFQLRADRTSTTVPEPGSLGLAGLALAGLLLRRRGQA